MKKRNTGRSRASSWDDMGKRMGSKSMGMRYKMLGNKVMTVLLTVAMVVTQTPVPAYAAGADAVPDAAPAATESSATVDAALNFDGAYITYAGQIIASPATKVTLPSGSDFSFTASADTGKELREVAVTGNGVREILEPNAGGVYTVPAAYVADGLAISVYAEDAPSVEQVPAATSLDGSEAATSEKATSGTDATITALETSAPTKDVYTYEDDQVTVTATLTNPAAVPDDANFVVTPVTQTSTNYNYGAYMDALNESSVDKSVTYDQGNTLLYDVAFMVPKVDEAGKAIEGEFVEYEPTAGSVSVNIRFKNAQLSDGIDAKSADSVEVKHLPLSDAVRDAADSTAQATTISPSDVNVQDVDAQVDVSGETVTLTTASLSVFSVTAVANGQVSVKLQVLSDDGAPASADISNLYVYFEGPNYTRIIVPMTKQSDGSYAATATGLLDQNGSKQNNGSGGYYPITNGQTYSCTVFSCDGYVWEGSRLDNVGGRTEYADGSVLNGQFKLSIPSDAQVSTGGTFTITARPLGPAGSETFESILGEAVNYGIITGKFSLLSGDAETNVAAVEGTCTVQTGSDLTNDVEQTFILASISNAFKIKGYGAYVMTTTADMGKVESVGARYLTIDTSKSKEELEAMVNAMLNHAANQSAALSAKESNASITYRSNDQRYVVDVRGRGDGAYYVDVDDATYQNIQQADKLQVYKDDGQTVVFNFRQSGNVHIQKFSVNEKGSDTFLGKDAGITPSTIVLNFPNATSITNDGSITGIVLAPNASVHVQATSSGWLISHEVNIGSGEWHNVYQHVEKISQGSSATFEATKHIDGVDSTVSGFTFELAERQGDEWVKLSDATSNGSKIEFEKISYGEDGFPAEQSSQDHVYRIRETQGKTDSSGKSYRPDETVYYAKVTVAKVVTTADGTQKTLYSASAPQYFADEACTQAIDGEPTFNNSSESAYQASGSIVLTGTKSVKNKAAAVGGFSFTVREGEKKVASGVSDASGKITFAPIGFEKNSTVDQTGRHTYVVTEDVPEGATQSGDGTWTKNGINYDGSSKTVNVTVSDKGDGTLEATVDQGADPISFVNTYDATGSLKLSGTKALKGKEMADGQFAFTVKSNGTKVATGLSKANGTIDFTEITYALEDAGKTFTYVVTEDDAGKTDSGVTYDGSSKVVKVMVADNGDGTLGAKVVQDESQDLNFVNTYRATGSVTLSGTKRIEGTDELDAAGYSFVVKEGDAVVATGTSDASGKIDFGSITYSLDREHDIDQTGKHVYTVSEVNGGKEINDVTYSAATYTVEVRVTDNGDGTLKVEKSDNADHLDFVNTYAYKADGSASLSVRKALSNGDVPAEGAYSFELRDERGNVLQTKTNDASGLVSFDKISYSINDLAKTGDGGYAPKTFVYTVHESSAAASGWSNAGDVTIRVNVSDNGDGTLKITYGDSNELTFVPPTMTNTYDASGTARIEGVKNLVGRTIKSAGILGTNLGANGQLWSDVDEFTFTLSALTDGAKLPADTVKSVKATEAGKNSVDFAFGDIAYTLADIADGTRNEDGRLTKTFVYKVRETASISGVTNDAADHLVRVIVTDNGDGTLKTAVDYGTIESKLAFTNTYAAEGEYTLDGTKTVENRSNSAAGFTFTVREGEKIVASGVSDASGKISYTPIHYKLDGAKGIDDTGEHTYTVTEDVPGDATKNADGTWTKDGIVYDGSEKTVKVTVSDNGDGTLKTVASPGADARASFVNTYGARGSISLRGEKSLSGQGLRDGQFSFSVYDAGGNVVSTGKNDADGAISFEDIEYTLADSGKTLTYTIKEDIPDGATQNDDGTWTKAGIVYDGSEKTVKVKVADNGDGTLTTTLDQGSDAISFINTYRATGSVTFKGTKTLEGKELTEGAFTFSVTENGREVATGRNAADGVISFDAISYTLDMASGVNDTGMHTYVVTERPTDQAGVTTDGRSYSVTVDVSDNGDGTLKVEKSDNAEALDFVNTYDAKGSITLAAHKRLEGQDLVAGAYTFVVKDANGNVVKTATNDAQGNVSFDNIEYTLADLKKIDGTYDASKTFSYTISEVIPDGSVESGDHMWTKGGTQYDGHVYGVDVTVENKGDGTLSTKTQDGYSAPVFVNRHVASGTVALTAQKVYKRGTVVEPLRGGEFDFSLRQVDERGEAIANGVVQTAHNDASGQVTFEGIKYAKGDAGKDFYYEVSEIKPDNASPYVDYDAAKYIYKVHVSDNGDGTLETTKTLLRGSDDQGDTVATFTNTYRATGTFELKAQKRYPGQTLGEGAFEFIATDKDTGEEHSAKNDASGRVSFPTITYRLDGEKNDLGTHTYVVREKPGNLDYVTYDSAEYEVTVEVSDNGDGTLSATQTSAAAVPTFTNGYSAKGSTAIEGTKSLVGKDLADGAYTFKLTNKDDGTVSTATNQGGSFRFDLNYTYSDLRDEAGNPVERKDFHYNVSEVANSGAGISYDESAYDVTVTVTDNHDGTLSVEKNVSGGRAIAFTNTYSAIGHVDFDGVKRIDSRGLKDGEAYTFTVTEDGRTVGTATNDASGKIDYPTIEYTYDPARNVDETGAHTYVVREALVNAAGITSDSTAYEVTVNVSDNGDGTLKADATPNHKKLDFTNAYAASGSFALEGTKVLEGADLATGAFDFKVMEGDVQVAAGKNDATGKVAFDTITYKLDKDESDLGTHTYTVSESIPEGATKSVDGTFTKDGIIYSGKTYTFTVDVTDNGDGTLNVDTSNVPTPQDLVFSNEYRASGSATISGSKSLVGKELADGAFTFRIAGEGVDKTTTNNGGSFSFDLDYTIDDLRRDDGTYALSRDFSYVVSEVAPQGVSEFEGVTYDRALKNVTVRVENDGKGHLSTSVLDSSDEVSFSNTYDAAGGFTVDAKKTLGGRELRAGEFGYVIEEVGADGTLAVVSRATNAADGSVSFPRVDYGLDEVGTHRYVMSEVIPAGAIDLGNNRWQSGNTVYDATRYEFSTNVTDGGRGALDVEVTGLPDDVTFVNDNIESASAVLTATKTVNGNVPAEGAFTFELRDAEGNVIDTRQNAGNGLVTFAPISYSGEDAGRTFTYTVSERNEGKAGYTYDGTTYTYEVAVSVGPDGTLSVTPTLVGATEAVFSNTYRATGSVSLTAKKTLENKSLEAGAYDFVVEDGEGRTVATGSNDASGNVSFSAIDFAYDPSATPAVNDLGEHAYTVREVIPNGATRRDDGRFERDGVIYDGSSKTVRVIVSDNGDGTLKAELAEGEKAPSFTNTYDAAGSITLPGTKALEGRSLADGQFTFSVKDDQGNKVATGTNAADGSIVFGAISYGLEDAGKTFSYTVTEDIPEGSVQNERGAWTKDGVTYDASTKSVRVAVSDNGDGTLTATLSQDSDTISFINTYGATGELRLGATKMLENHPLEEGAYAFRVIETTGGASNVVAEARNGSDGSVSFPAIAYTLADAGRHTYVVSEVVPEGAVQNEDGTFTRDGVTYSNASYTVETTVADNGDGTLSVSKSEGPRPITFVNTYSAKGTARLEAAKRLTGATLSDGQFTFVVKGANGEVVGTAVNDAEGNVSFAPIEYAAAGEYDYSILETADQKGGYTYSKDVVKAHVSARDNGKGAIETRVTYDGAESKPTFTNEYEATGTARLYARKVLEVAEGANTTLDDLPGFDFALTEVDGGGTPVENGVSQVKTSDNTGAVTFDAMSYDQDDLGTHYYQVREIVPEGATEVEPGVFKLNGVTYDSTVRTERVNVSDRGDGTLRVTYGANEAESAGELAFTNRYEADATDIAIPGTKELVGRDLSAGEFSFGIYSDAVSEQPLATATNDKNGSFTIGTSNGTFKAAGTFTYYVREVVPEEGRGGIAYDGRAWPIEVKVRDDHRGKLVGTAEYATTGADGRPAGSFVNGYDAAGSATVVAEKRLTGMDLAAGQFSFTLYEIDSEGNLVEGTAQSVQNDASGRVTFQPLEYTLKNDMVTAGGDYLKEKDFRYVIREDVPALATDNGDGTATLDDMTYDKHDDLVTVRVRDNGNGVLETSVAYDEDGAVFSNKSFKAHATIHADKSYFGTDNGAQFVYELRASDVEGNLRGGAGATYGEGSEVIDEGQQFSVTATNASFADGKASIALPEITYYHAGDYYYVLSEVQNRADANDSSRYLIKVSVDEGRNARVTARLLGVDDAPREDRNISFYNNGIVSFSFASASLMAMAEEAHQVSISPTITKKLENATLRSGQFDFDLRGSDGSLIEVAQNDATGKVAFGRLEFYEPGEYDFTVSEETGNADDAVVYSDEVLGLHVSVRETPEGKLVATQSWTKDGVALVSEGTNASDVSPTITNEAVTLEVRVQKCSKDAPYEPLVNARYGLWRVNPSGNDIYMGNRLSGTDGYMSFDVPLEDGVAYYFKEESAPNGHLVDPYRTAYFTIAHEGGRFWMVYEADPAFATWAPDVK